MKYREVNGTCYHVDTPSNVIERLERARKNRLRIRLWYGDTDMGKDWQECIKAILEEREGQ